MRGYYSEKWKIINFDDTPVLIWVTSDIGDEELATFFKIAVDQENYEYAQALMAEAESRGLKLKFG